MTPSPPDELVTWWRAEYPAIADESGVRVAVDAAGYSTIGHFVLPAESWRSEFYGPMERRLAEFRTAHPGDPTAQAVAAEAEHELEMFGRYSEHYSYAFFVVQPQGHKS